MFKIAKRSLLRSLSWAGYIRHMRFELIRTVRCFSDNYIIVLSYTGKDDELIKIMKEGADRYIKKPISTLELIARIKAL
jgi:DNA-binding response OmpR family regulator